MCIRDSTGEAIAVPVGPETLGRIINVIGDPIDERGDVGAKIAWPIHRPAPEFIDQATETEILATGIKVVDLIAPYSKGGKIGLFGGAGEGSVDHRRGQRVEQAAEGQGQEEGEELALAGRITHARSHIPHVARWPRRCAAGGETSG